MNDIEEKPGNEQEDVALRLKEIKLARENEKKWCEAARKADEIYRGDRTALSKAKKPTFNILWANVDIKRQAIYNNLPTPDIRKRYKDDDPIGDAVSDLMERAVTYILDCKDIDADLIHAANDMLVPGRAVLRVKYKSEVETLEDAGEEYETVGSQEVELEPCQYDEFLMGSAKTFDDVPWITFIHKLRKKEVEERWPDHAEHIKFEVRRTDNGSGKEETVYKEAEIYELWNKEDKKVYWIAKDYPDGYLEVQDDPMELRNFWPIAKPLYAIESTTSLIPQTEFSKYEVLAEELELVSTRLNKIAKAISVRGVYDSSISEIEKVFEADDNAFIPAENMTALLERGGLEKAIWMLPIEMLVGVRSVLGQQRDALLGQIYEITGISDIVRGQTNPNETAKAQQIKASFGSMRLEKQKQALQKFARDTIRIIVEVMAENYTRENLSAITGLKFPTMAEKQAAQMQIQQQQMMAQQQAQMQPQQGQPPQPPEVPPEIQEMLSKPSWEDIEQVLHSDMQRDYRIDIETDSTIAADQQKEQQTISEYLQGMGQFVQHAGAGMQVGVLSRTSAKAMMKAFARKFKLGREVEDELEMDDPPPPPDPAAQAEQQKQQFEMQKMQMQLQSDQQKQQFDAQKRQADAQVAQMKAQMEMQSQQAEIELKRAELSIEQEKLNNQRLQVEIERESLANKNLYAEAKHARDMEKIHDSPQ